MTRILLGSVLSASLVLVGLSPAFAQSRPAARPAEAHHAQPRAHNVEIEADTLLGEVQLPPGDRSTARGVAEHGSLIRVRTEFVREIARAAEDL